MKDNQDNVKRRIGETGRIIKFIWVLFGIIVIAGIYFLVDPTLSFFKGSTPEEEMVTLPIEEDDFDKIENGIHIRTGFVDAPGMIETVQNCTNCHSSKLVIQNRMNKERWIATIRWMQETQNLWNLGKNEEIIVDYLVTNYPPKEIGRRENLSNIDWYTLKD